MSTFMEAKLIFPEEYREVITALLFSKDVTGIEDTEDGLIAYFEIEEYPDFTLQEFLTTIQMEFDITVIGNELQMTNWNQVWETNYSPIEVDDYCYIYAPFHEKKSGFKHTLLINPRMAFGTGHHETTRLMLDWMQTLDFSGKSVLDLGCGTGILALIAAKEGAQSVLAVDYDQNCMDSLKENIEVNNTPTVQPLLGSIENVEKQPFDIILANINRNFLLNNLSFLNFLTSNRTKVLLSGFYMGDVIHFTEALFPLNWGITAYKEENKWVALLVEKM